MTDACYKAGQSGEVAAQFSAVVQQTTLSNSHDLRAANDPASPTLAIFYKAMGSVLQNGSKLDRVGDHANIVAKQLGCNNSSMLMNRLVLRGRYHQLCRRRKLGWIILLLQGYNQLKNL